MRFLLIVLLFPLAAHARWMNASEADVAIIEESVQIQVKANARAVYHNLQKVKILNETGRSTWGTRRLVYSPKNSRFKVIQASTQVAGTNFIVDKHDIVDTEVDATENGFDETRQVVIPFRQVETGSVVSLATRNEIFRPVYEKQFSDRFFVGDYYLQQKWNIEINSEIRLYFEFNDPDAHLEFTKTEKPHHYVYKVRLKEALIQRPIEEIRYHSNEKKLTWVQVSSAERAVDVAKPIAQLYEKILNQELPKAFEPIIVQAKRETDPIRQINFVLSSVADKIRYMGDWRSIDGAYIPRALAKISETHFGDCKDLATLTAKLLRILGYEADVAWVFRGKVLPITTDFGYLNFNHAIVSVRLTDKQLWLDATNFQSYAQGIFEDIGGRRALLMNPKRLEFRSIEFSPSNQNREVTEELTSLNSIKERHNSVKVDDSGAFALNLAGAELKDSKEQIEKAYIDLYANVSDLIGYKFEPFDLKSRAVQALQFRFSYDTYFRPTETSLGPAYDFSPPQIIKDIINVDRKTRVSDLQLEVPSEAVNVFKFEKIKGKGDGLKNCRIESPWLSYAFEVEKNRSQVTRSLVIKKYFVSLEDVKSKTFEDFQNEARTCGLNKYLVLDLPN